MPTKDAGCKILDRMSGHENPIASNASTFKSTGPRNTCGEAMLAAGLSDNKDG